LPQPPPAALKLFGITLVGVTPENGRKLVLSIALIVGTFVIGWALRRILILLGHFVRFKHLRFWGRQAVSMLLAAFVIVGLISIWFEDPARLSTALGLVTAGVAFALQRVITATAGYFVILRGKTFNVGDRIVMGGVRGDVIALSFMQTTIMEMGQPPPIEKGTDPAMWIHSRQFTGRIVTVTNDKIFSEPVYNYTHHFPYIWEEMRIPIGYTADRDKAERIILAAAAEHAVHTDKMTAEALDELFKRYNIAAGAIEPRVYWRITDNYVELTVRFLAPDHGTRDIKDKMSRDILAAFDEAGIAIGSTTFEITGLPKIQLRAEVAPS
jgi:small-conductance mechanosensitive channel